MTVNMTMSFPDDVAAYVKSKGKGNASAYTSRMLRKQMLAEALQTHPVPDHNDTFGHAAQGAFAPGTPA